MKLTLDIGGSKTRGFIYGENEPKAFEIVGGFGLTSDTQDVLSSLHDALQKNLGADGQKITAVAVNLGGKNKMQIQNTLQSLFPFANIWVRRESEGATAFEIMRSFHANVLIMAGTGCIAFAKNENSSFVLGGWGKDYGDEGSGYFIGISAIKRALKELDGNDELSLLTKKLFGVSTPFAFTNIEEYCAARDDARAKIPKTREGVAALTRTVVDCANDGCALSNEILCENARHIRDFIRLATMRANIKNPVVVINGGITNSKQLWQQELQEFENVIYTNDGIDRALKNILETL